MATEVTTPTTLGPSEETGTTAKPWPGVVVRGLQLAALWALGVVQPLFDVLDGDAAFFVARGNTSADIVKFAVGLTILPPLVLALVEAGASAVNRRAGRVVHLVFLALLVGIIAMQILKDILPSDAAVVFPASLIVGGVIAWLYTRASGLRTFFTILTPAPLIFLGLFLLASPVSSLVFPEGATAGVGSTGGNRTPVVLVILDEVPAAAYLNAAGQVDASRYPNLAALAKTSTWYRNNTTVADGTFAAVPAILAGQRPTDALKPDRVYDQSVYTLLAPTHSITSVEAITRVCPTSLCERKPVGSASKRMGDLINDLSVVSGRIALPNDLSRRLPAVDTDYEAFDNAADEDLTTNDALVGTAQSKVKVGGVPIVGGSVSNTRLREVVTKANGISAGDKPPLYVLHIEIPHVPWRFLPTGEQYPVGGPSIPGLEDQTWTKDPYQVNLGLQRFLMQTEYGDRILGQIVATMKRTGIWDQSLFIVTADHGASFRPGGSRRPITAQNFADIANTPLFVKYPGETRGEVKTTATHSVDILPTIAKVTDTGGGRTFEGRPLDEDRPDSDPQVRNGRLEKPLSMPYQEFLRQRDALVRSLSAAFGAGAAGLYRLGPNAALIGTKAPKVAAASATRAKIDTAKVFRRVRPGSGVLPAYVTGTTQVKAGSPLAAAVNGRVAAVGKAFSTPEGTRFAIMLPPKSLKRGANTVEVFAIAPGRRLALIGSTAR